MVTNNMWASITLTVYSHTIPNWYSTNEWKLLFKCVYIHRWWCLDNLHTQKKQKPWSCSFFLFSLLSVYLHVMYYFSYTHFNFCQLRRILWFFYYITGLENNLKCQSEVSGDFTVTTSPTLKLSSDKSRSRESDPKNGSCRNAEKRRRHLSSRESNWMGQNR